MAFADDQLASARQEVMSAPMLPLLLLNGAALQISNEIPEGVKAHTFQVTDSYGIAQIMSSRSTNVPLIGDSMQQNVVRIFPIKIGFDIDEDQIKLSQRNGRNIFTEKLLQSRDAIDQKLDLIAFAGEPNTTLMGISNYPGVTILQMPADGTGGSRAWSSKSPMLILRDLNLIATGVNSQTAGTVNSDRILLGHDVALYLQNTVFNDRGDSILKVFLDNQRILANGIREVIGHPSLDNVGVGGTSRAVAYTSSSRYNKLHIPQGGGFRDSGLDKKGDVYYLECKALTAGVEIQRIKEIIYADIQL